jgi:hypothetical protein
MRVASVVYMGVPHVALGDVQVGENLDLLKINIFKAIIFSKIHPMTMPIKF